METRTLYPVNIRQLHRGAQILWLQVSNEDQVDEREREKRG